jgi:hypothetical protein
VNEKENLYTAGIILMQDFCKYNNILEPKINRLAKTDRLYSLGTCAFYRPETITIMVEKCANRGYAGRAWSWPGYAIDRTPYGVIQHELGHHVDNYFSVRDGELFSKKVYESSKESPLTGYLGTDKEEVTYFKEWFAEHFRLFVTNPDLSANIAPKFFYFMVGFGFLPVFNTDWEQTLLGNLANSRIVEQARKKIDKKK